jgi:putative ABC transport system permease protein
VTWQLFLRAASLQRKRAVLTIAAIAWGTVCVLMLLAFGQGLKDQLMKARSGMGENLAVIWPGSTSRVWQGLPEGRQVRMRIDDLGYLRSRLPDVEIIGEVVSWSSNLTAGKTAITGRVIGTNWEYGEIRHHRPQKGGRFLDPIDEREKRRVVFLGDELAPKLFGKDDPVGKPLLINGATYTVIGVMRHKLQMGNYGGMDADHAVVPLTTLAAQLGRHDFQNLVLRTSTPEQMPGALQRFREVMGARYRFDPNDEQALGVWDTVKSSKSLRNMTLGFQIFFGLVGAMTLLIGGVGVANIMYAVVKEKTREIGVEMALGARGRWITGSIVLQGLAYTLVGGAVGTLVAVMLVSLLDLIPTQGNQALEFLGKPTLSWMIAVVTAALLGSIGILAGFFPARRAATIDPAETLRYE